MVEYSKQLTFFVDPFHGKYLLRRESTNTSHFLHQSFVRYKRTYVRDENIPKEIIRDR